MFLFLMCGAPGAGERCGGRMWAEHLNGVGHVHCRKALSTVLELARGTGCGRDATHRRANGRNQSERGAEESHEVEMSTSHH